MAKPTYQTLDQREHVLTRPDMYIGSIKTTLAEYYSSNSKNSFKITQETGKINQGLHRIFIEILSNAIDNVWRSSLTETKQKKIMVTIEKDTGRVTVWNDGLNIPIEINQKTGLYNPEMIFGSLLSGSNFNDEEQRMTSGRNGLGSTCTSIFSKEFTVKVGDPENEKKYTQSWFENMTKKEKPKITSYKNKTGYVEVSFIPDFKRFGEDGWSNEHLGLILKNIVDTAMIVSVDGVSVWYNGEKIPVKNIKEYAYLYQPLKSDAESVITTSTTTTDSSETKEFKDTPVIINTDDCDIAFLPSPQKDGKLISFVNGIETTQGGVHVDKWLEGLLRPVLDKINGKKEKPLTMRDIKPYFSLFLCCKLDKPSFTSQEKIKLASPAPKVELNEKHLKTILKWSVIESIKEEVESRDLQALKKVENKGKGYKKIEKYERANDAGTKKSGECILFLTEGDSAKTFVISGMSTGVYGKKGRDSLGVYPLKGKGMNVRDKKADLIAKNKEICNIIQILNLKIDVDYTKDENFSTLNYGKVVVVADSDVDGAHILGLLINLFHSLYPSLIKRNGFLTSMRTPIIRAKNGKNALDFFTKKDFEKWLKDNYNKGIKTKYDIKYYKGLGSNTRDEAREVFGKKMIEFVEDKNADANMNKVFNSKMADKRKAWIGEYNPHNDTEIVSKDPIQKLDITKFLDHEMIHFSIDDNRRSIPSVVDGLKESQRKIIYASFLKNLKKECKVAQLAGFIAEKAGYHHGEVSLTETIVKLAQDFRGSNNIPYFTRGGAFGSLSENGSDAASPRYIFTALEPITELIFNRKDEPILTQLEDDGDKIEWEYFVPCIPMTLINGAQGIGTGWSTDIPFYNPKELIEILRLWLNKGRDSNEKQFLEKCDSLKPWYKGFKGTIEKLKEQKYITKGILTDKGKGVWRVSSLPIGMSINQFKEQLDDLLEEKKIKNYNNYSTENDVSFDIIETKDKEMDLTLESLKLTSKISTSNMVLFDRKGMIKKYSSCSDILTEYCEVRYEYYIKRKAHQLKVWETELKYLRNKYRFLQEVMSKKMVIDDVSDDDLLERLVKGKYDRAEKSGTEDDGKLSDYSYLLSMNIRSFTKVKVEKLSQDINELEKNIEELRNTTETQIWLRELDQIEKML